MIADYNTAPFVHKIMSFIYANQMLAASL